MRQAEAEGLTLLKADSNSSGYEGVTVNKGTPKPYQAQVRRGDKKVHLGSYSAPSPWPRRRRFALRGRRRRRRLWQRQQLRQ